jgi:hypothetical protein
MLMAGGVAALAAAGGGLAVLATLTLIGWITAPHVGLGGGLAGALRSAGLLCRSVSCCSQPCSSNGPAAG